MRISNYGKTNFIFYLLYFNFLSQEQQLLIIGTKLLILKVFIICFNFQLLNSLIHQLFKVCKGSCNK